MAKRARIASAAASCWALWTDDGLFSIARFCDPLTLASMMRVCKRWNALLCGVFMAITRDAPPHTWSWRTARNRPGRALFARIDNDMCDSASRICACFPNVSVLWFNCDMPAFVNGDADSYDALDRIATAFPGAAVFIVPTWPSSPGITRSRCMHFMQKFEHARRIWTSLNVANANE